MQDVSNLFSFSPISLEFLLDFWRDVMNRDKFTNVALKRMRKTESTMDIIDLNEENEHVLKNFLDHI